MYAISKQKHQIIFANFSLTVLTFAEGHLHGSLGLEIKSRSCLSFSWFSCQGFHVIIRHNLKKLNINTSNASTKNTLKKYRHHLWFSNFSNHQGDNKFEFNIKINFEFIVFLSKSEDSMQ